VVWRCAAGPIGVCREDEPAAADEGGGRFVACRLYHGG